MKDAPYRALGTFRFALAATVVLSHTWFLSFNYRNFVQDIGIGNFAVMGFFVLSGFIISEAVDVFYRDRPGAFLANRFLRLAPPYWAAAIASIIVHAVLLRMGLLRLPDYASAPGVMFDFRNILVQITGIFPVFNVNHFLPRIEWYYFVRFSWAIFVEFVFYFSVAILLAFWPLAARLFSIRGYLISAATAVLGLHIFSEYVRQLHTSLAFLPYFVLGAAIYCAKARREAAASLTAAVAYVLVAVHFLRYTQGQLSFYENWWGGAIRPVVFIPTVSMLAIPFLFAFISGIHLPERLAKIDRSIGDLTYPLYLNHYAVLVAAYSLSSGPSWAIQIAAIAVSVVAALALQRLVEGPMTMMRDRIRGQRLTVEDEAHLQDELDHGSLVTRTHPGNLGFQRDRR